MVATTLGNSWGIPIGSEVRTADGEHLGTVVEGDAYELVVERGWFFVHDYQISLSDVDRFEEGILILRLTKAEVEQEGDADPAPPTCAECGGTISQDDIVCPHCGVSLVGG
jgi:hypothetical protein